MYSQGLFFAKLSILLLFRRVFNISRNFRFAWYAVTTIWCLYILAVELVTLLSCIPIHKQWHPLEKGHCISLVTFTVDSGYINIITDFIILFLPLPMVWNLQLKPELKLGLLGVFATGLL